MKPKRGLHHASSPMFCHCHILLPAAIVPDAAGNVMGNVEIFAIGRRRLTSR
jgi:hypothetical protein